VSNCQNVKLIFWVNRPGNGRNRHRDLYSCMHRPTNEHSSHNKTRHSQTSDSAPVHASPYGPLRQNMTSSIKPEIRNASQRCQRRTEPQPCVICTKNFVKIGSAMPEICSRTDRRTDKQTVKLIAILCSPTGAE